MSKHYIGEVGATIVVDTKTDITDASIHQLHVKKPDGTVVIWDAELYTIKDETTRLRYITIPGDFDQVGKYLVQPYLILPEWSGYGETSYFLISNLFN